MQRSADVVVVGGGIAGASAAYFLALEYGQGVRLIETEPRLAHHTTGRSAAQLIENYGAAPLRALTKASLPFFTEPPDGLVDGALLTGRGVLTLGGADDHDAIDTQLAEGRAINPTIAEVDIDTALALMPILRREWIQRAIWEPQASDIDVAGLHQAFVRGLRRAGGSVSVATRLDCATPDGEHWQIDTSDGVILAGHIINAAGAWGDVVARCAGVEPVGLTPMRRTAFMVASPDPDSRHWPLVADAGHHWYCKPDGTQLLCSPADETPSDPVDAKPEELDIAIAIDHINAATTLDIASIASSWAGLRTFAPDRSMVIGPDPERPNFHWCVGQGGTGIQTAPGAGRLSADLVTIGRPGATFDGFDLDLDGLTPQRLR